MVKDATTRGNGCEVKRKPFEILERHAEKN
jgi:hypothetical protein